MVSPATSPLLGVVHQAGGGLASNLVQALFEHRAVGQLLPLQRQVFEQTSVLRDGESLLVSAPTASGKTMVAEWAIASALGRSRCCLYLVPTRALAEQTTRELRAWLEPLGVSVACSTSEARSDDRRIAACQVDVVVSVYEKAFLLAPPASSLWANLGLIVADEVQLVGDRERGPAIDLWLTRWRRESTRSRPHLVALSAVLGQPERLADWLGVRLVRSTARRLPLREGTLHLPTGRFHWRDAQTQEEGEETLIAELGHAGGNLDDDRAALALAGLAHRAGPVLVFCATRREAVGLAYRLAETALPTRRPAGTPWESLPRDQARAWLEDLMPCGVGIHTADLAPAHREIVERAFDAGDLSILVATPTLEQGVNLSAATVVSTGRALERDPLSGRNVLVPMGRARFANQGGRAGRGAMGVGRSVVMVESDVEAAQVWRTLITPEADRLASALGCDSMLGALAGLIGDGVVRSRA